MNLAIAAISWILMSDPARSQGLIELVALYDYDRKAPLNIEQNEMPTRGGYKLVGQAEGLPENRVRAERVPDSAGSCNHRLFWGVRGRCAA